MATITSSSPSGTVVVMNSWIDPSNTDQYLKLTETVASEFRKHPENLFTAICVNPTDRGNIRVVHGWTKDSAWFFKNIMEGQTLLKTFNAETEPMWLKPCVIEHFDRHAES